MKFSFDIHGCIDDLPEVFSFLTKVLCDAKCEVHILTGSKWTLKIEDELKCIGIKYTHHFSITDYHISIGTPMRYSAIDNPWIDTGDKEQDNIIWDRTKADYCAKHKIDLHIDDTLRYNDFFKKGTAFARIFTHTGTPKPIYKNKRHLD